MTNLKQIDKLVVTMSYNFTSLMYHFISMRPNGNLVFYHQGHKGDFVFGYNTIEELLKNGYDVIGVSMPLLGANNQPEIEFEKFGSLKFTNHNQLIFLESSDFSPIKFFVEPVVVAINYAQDLGYSEIDMVGISGGGWTTVICSAIDDRILKSYPVAGSYPIYIRFENVRDWGDYEQTNPGLYRVANYLELYILGSFGEDRKQVQILNFYDKCCFAGNDYKSYEYAIKKKMEQLNYGNFTIVSDATHSEHKISDAALEFIINDLK